MWKKHPTNGSIGYSETLPEKTTESKQIETIMND